MNQVVVKQEKSGYQIVEAYKSLRTNLQFCGEDKKVIAVTSCTPNEGKSSVSMQLGISLAESGKRVILIDADLRKSVLLGRTKTQKSVRGLAHFLSGQATLEDVICSTNVKNFYMIYSGPFPPNPAELLGGKNFRSLLNALRKVYDYVIVDTPPLGSVIDSAIVAEICDGSIMVIESGVISYRFAQEVKSQLERSNCPLLGTRWICRNRRMVNTENTVSTNMEITARRRTINCHEKRDCCRFDCPVRGARSRYSSCRSDGRPKRPGNRASS